MSASPADPDDELGRFEIASASQIDGAVERAQRAFPAWRAAGFEARAGVLRRFRDLAAAAAPELAQLLAREIGKALWDARGEAALLAPKVDVTLADGMKFVTPIDAGAGARAVFEPRGVLAVLGPFNFPAHLPNGHIAPALATGNCVVFKPSDQAPAVGAFIANLWRRAGLPVGVLELVQGRAETGRTLALHPGVGAVLFTGSWAVGRSLQEACLDQPGKLLALELGGKNAIVVMDDADLDLAVAETALSIAATTGQRCSCASRLFVQRGIEDAFVDKLIPVLTGLRVGNPLDPKVFMGPLISEAAHARLTAARASLREAGGERLVLADPGLPPPFTGAGLVRFARTDQRHPAQREEFFGPEAALYPIDDLDHAIAAVNDSDYGLVASIFSRERASFDAACGRIETGLFNWNRATVGASGRLPFGGRKKSGNDRPAGVLASLYCTTPQARLENAGPFDPTALPPGLPRP